MSEILSRLDEIANELEDIMDYVKSFETREELDQAIEHIRSAMIEEVK